MKPATNEAVAAEAALTVDQVTESPTGGKTKTSAKSAALKAWRLWRKENKGPLEEILTNPVGFELYKTMKKTSGSFVADSFEKWLQHNEQSKLWFAWRQAHTGPLREVLRDPEGWNLFRALKLEKGQAIPPTYEEWLELPEHKAVARRQEWSAWRRSHPGPLVTVLMDPEGWAFYRQAKVADGKDIPDQYRDWVEQPAVRRQAALDAWTHWRHGHPGQLTKVLADPEGWALYKVMAESADKSVQGTYEEWLEIRNTALTSRTAWRRSHSRGPLVEVLKDPAVYESYLLYNSKKGITVPSTYDEWIQLPEQQKAQASLKWSSWRKAHKGPLIEVLRNPEGWSLYVDMQQKTGNDKVPASYAEWVELYRPGRSSTSTNSVSSKWLQWRRSHEGPLEDVLADPEGWSLYSAHMQQRRRGGGSHSQSFPSDYGTWRTYHEVESKWTEWRKLHAGPLHRELGADPEGWNLYVDRCVSRGVQIPPTYTEWMKLPEQQALVDAEMWTQWRQNHPGPLLDALERDPTAAGWALYRSMLRASSGQLPIQVPDDLQEWMSDCSRIAKLCWRAWREKHKGPLRRVLSDPLGWALYKSMLECTDAGANNTASGSSAASILEFSTYEEWSEAKGPGRNAWIQWRRLHKGPLHEVLQDPEGWALYRASQMSKKGSKVIPETVGEFLEQPEQQKALATYNWALWRRDHRGPLLKVLEDPEGWALYSDLMKKVANKVYQSYEEWANSAEIHKGRAAREWRAWRRMNKGPLVDALANPEGWVLYKAWAVSENRPVVETYEEWCGQKDKEREWRDWRAKHGGPLHLALADPAGWEVYKRYCVARAKHSNAVPDAYEEWMSLPEQQQQLRKDAWVTWRQLHRGNLADVLSDPEGWTLFYNMKIAAHESIPTTYEEWVKTRPTHNSSNTGDMKQNHHNQAKERVVS
ncbi:p97 [Cystoisospora suis]|uniref:p97 n=1 Tax=Cystoisospora suis TaxID=483139 RepID=A0A2C6KLB0_9APIC|nr:p97 [Cystoisospora suis]